MATTAGGTPYVESSDLVANYPAVSLALAEHIDDTSTILQVVRATDATDRSTTSTSFVDVTGMTVTITPQKSDSAILIVCVGSFRHAATTPESSVLRLTDSSNVALSGAQEISLGQNTTAAAVINRIDMAFNLIGYVLPGVTTAVTYKMQFRSLAGTQTTTIRNAVTTGQMYAIEVSA
jgi:hypothetical protein